MPYVEGFGTYPFGEEWLFDAVIRSYLPVLEVAARPDDDGDARCSPTSSRTAGVGERLREFLVELADRRAPRPTSARCRPSAGRRLRGRASSATGTRWSCSTRPAATRWRRSARRRRGAGRARRLRGDPRGPAAAGDPARAAAAARRRASARTAAASAGTAASGCPSAPTRPASSGGWPSTACAGSASTRARTSEPLDALAPVATEAGPVALPIDWEAVSWLWSLDGYPSAPAHAQFAGQIAARDPDLEGRRRRLRPGCRARRRPRARRGEFLAAVAGRLRDFAERARPPRPARLRDRHRAARPLVVGGAALARGGAAGRRRRRGVRLVTAPGRRSREHEPDQRAARGVELGRGQGPPHLGLAGGRRPRLGRRGGWSCACCGRWQGACAATRRRAPHASCWRCRRATGRSSTAWPGGRLRLPARDRPRPARCSRP